MTVKRSGLGRNLSALLSPSTHLLFDDKPLPLVDHLTLNIDCIRPGVYQPRGEIVGASLHELAESIKKQGLLQPLIVRELKDKGCYELIAGERRWRASQLAGLSKIPVILKQVDDETALAIALVENLQREDLNAMDQARAMQRLIHEFHLTHQQVAELLSKSRTAVSNYLRLLSLSSQVKKLLEDGSLDMGHARALLSLELEQQNQVAQLITAKNLSVRETEKLVERIKSGASSSDQPSPTLTEALYSKAKVLAQHLQTQVKIKPGKAGSGSLLIHYDSSENLAQIIEQLINENHKAL